MFHNVSSNLSTKLTEQLSSQFKNPNESELCDSLALFVGCLSGLVLICVTTLLLLWYSFGRGVNYIDTSVDDTKSRVINFT